jgi:hypothetical protein
VTISRSEDIARVAVTVRREEIEHPNLDGSVGAYSRLDRGFGNERSSAGMLSYCKSCDGGEKRGHFRYCLCFAQREKTAQDTCGSI